VPEPKICPRCGDSYDDAVDFCAKDGTRLVRSGQTVDLIGTVIAERYRVVSRIGEGGMGQVFLAEHVRMKRKSAIKIMRPSLVGDVEALQRFTREAENASQLSHPNIAAIFDFGETADGVVYLAMEYVDGDSLGVLLDRETALHPDIAADILGQAADALQAAHDAQMLHRDIKPDNIMLGRRSDGTFMVKLVDFGIARSMDGSDQKVTRTGFAIGTPQYMSPEQLAGESLNAASDQYSLALVAYFALTGKQAFPAESSKESLIQRLTSRPPSLRDAKGDIEWPASLQDVFDRALAPEPADRFPVVSEFAHALSGAISSMTPTQTAEIYRRALDVRVANVAARTPHSDRESLRTLSGASMVIGSDAVGASNTAEATTLPMQQLAGDTANEGNTNGASGRDSGTSNATLDKVAVTGRSGANPTSDVAMTVAPIRWPVVIGGLVAIAAVVTFLVSRGRGGDTGTALARGDSSATVAIAAASGASASGAPASTPTAASGTSAGSSTTANGAAANGTAPATGIATATRTPVSANGAKPSTDSIKKIQRDSVRRDSVKREVVQRERETADSIARAKTVRLRFPEAALRGAIARGVDAKARIARNEDVRVNIMPTPVFVWREQQAHAWKVAHPKTSGTGSDLVDPVEAWSAWASLVASQRAVYVVEVAPDKVPWPSYAPDKIFDLKRGDVSGVELLRDGTPVPFETSARIAAFANATEHAAAGKAVPNAFVATISPATFLPHDDGTPPKIVVVVRDAMRNGAVVRIPLSDSQVKRLYEDFAPWRDAIARP